MGKTRSSLPSRQDEEIISLTTLGKIWVDLANIKQKLYAHSLKDSAHLLDVAMMIMCDEVYAKSNSKIVAITKHKKSVS